MKCLIFGAGGVGSYFGARLLKAGNEVLFVARGKHLDAIQDCGLKVTHPDMLFNQKVDALDMEALGALDSSSFDVIFIATKSKLSTIYFTYLYSSVSLYSEYISNMLSIFCI